jgi:hypothetical protein
MRLIEDFLLEVGLMWLWFDEAVIMAEDASFIYSNQAQPTGLA